jgi:radical SAM protein with 4Fe4S-binding SPASM domain
MNNQFDVNQHPLVVVWETTEPPASDSPESRSASSQLSDPEAEELIREVAELRPPIFVFAGDPLKRPAIFSFVRYAASCGLHPNMLITASPELTRKSIAGLKSAGLSRLGLTLHASSPELHDRLCGIEGSFARTLEAMLWARNSDMPLQVQTMVTKENWNELEAIAGILKKFQVIVWSVSFPVPLPGDEQAAEEAPTPQEFEEIFARLYALSQEAPFKIKTVEAQHYRRFVLQEKAKARALNIYEPTSSFLCEGVPGVLPINETRGSVFITCAGEVFASSCLPVSAGNIRHQKLTEIYRNSVLFKSLRDTSLLSGKCGRCEFKEICGGSRARSWAAAGDMFGEDSCCVYLPGSKAQARAEVNVQPETDPSDEEAVNA